MSGSNSNFFNGSVLPTNWNWGGMLGGSSAPGVMGQTDTFAPGTSPSNLSILPTGYGGNTNPTSGGAGIGGIGGSGFGLNVGTGQLAMSGLSALGNLWSAYQSRGLAQKQLDASTMFANANLGNQIKSYNTSLSDRETARGKTEGLSQDQINQYVSANSLYR